MTAGQCSHAANARLVQVRRGGCYWEQTAGMCACISKPMCVCEHTVTQQGQIAHGPEHVGEGAKGRVLWLWSPMLIGWLMTSACSRALLVVQSMRACRLKL